MAYITGNYNVSRVNIFYYKTNKKPHLPVIYVYVFEHLRKLNGQQISHQICRRILKKLFLIIKYYSVKKNRNKYILN